jgi:hypothetical protein
MRQLTIAVLSTLLIVATCGYCCAEESSSWWWPFDGGENDTPAATPPATAGQQLPTASKDSDAWWPTMPKLSWPESKIASGPHSAPREASARKASRGRPTATRQRNSWARSRAEPTKPAESDSPWKTVTDGAHKLGQSASGAWHKTVEVMKPGVTTDPRVARREPKVSWWSRMWGAEEAQPQGPRTVTEWMAQERLDP